MADGKGSSLWKTMLAAFGISLGAKVMQKVVDSTIRNTPKKETKEDIRRNALSILPDPYDPAKAFKAMKPGDFLRNPREAYIIDNKYKCRFPMFPGGPCGRIVVVPYVQWMSIPFSIEYTKRVILRDLPEDVEKRMLEYNTPGSFYLSASPKCKDGNCFTMNVNNGNATVLKAFDCNPCSLDTYITYASALCKSDAIRIASNQKLLHQYNIPKMLQLSMQKVTRYIENIPPNLTFEELKWFIDIDKITEACKEVT